MNSKYITEAEEEAFFERHFEYGDEETTSNAKIAIRLLEKSYAEVRQIATAAEDGECFDEATAVLHFQTLALSERFFMQFVSQLPDSEADELLKKLEVIKAQ